jgi:hypothetical protein
MCDAPFSLELHVAGIGCAYGENWPVQVDGTVVIEYFVERPDADSGFSRQTYDVWLCDLTINRVTCPECDRVLAPAPADLATLRARAAMDLMTTHRASLEDAAKEDWE